MTTYITHRRLSPPSSRDHQHITHVKWKQGTDTGSCTRAEMIDHIRAGNEVYVEGPPRVEVQVVSATPPYLRTYADGKPTNNLLDLPSF